MALGKTSNLVITATTHFSFTATWDPATDATGYKLIAQELSKDGNTDIGQPIEGTSVTTPTGSVSGLKPLTNYRLSVEATDGTTTSTSTSTKNFSTADVPELNPPIVTLTDVDWQAMTAKINWQADTNAGSYTVK